MRVILLAVGIALGVILASPARPQNNPGFNPNLAWGGVQGSLAIRGSANWQGLLPGTAGQALLSGGPGANPYWSTLSGTGTVTSVQGSGGTTGLTLSGGPITGAGTLTLGGTLVPANGGTGAAGAADTVFISNGTIGSWGTIGANSITAGAITNNNINASAGIGISKLAAIPSLSVVANITGGSAAPTTPTVTTLFDNAFGSIQGQILYRGASGWTALNPGSSGEFLRTNGAGANPQWQAVSGALGGTVTNVATGAGLTGGPITVTGTVAIDAGAIPGVANNSSATTGNVGEVISSNVLQGSAVNVNPYTAVDITSITLTAGDWDLSFNCYFQGQPGSSVNYRECSASSTSATRNNVSPYFQLNYRPLTVGGSVEITDSFSMGPSTVRLSGSTTYYLVAWSVHSAAGAAAFGEIRARRMR